MTDDTMAAAVKAAAEAVSATGVLVADLRRERDEARAEVERLRNPDLRIVMGYDLGREEGEREAVAAERTRIAAAIRAERDRCTLGSAMWATFEAAARIAEGETSTIRDANPGNAQDARRIAAVERLLDTAERQHRVVVTVTSVRLALGNADVPMSPDKGHDAMLTIETIEGRFNPAAPKPSADQRPEWLKQAEPNPRIATVALACASSYEWARIAVEALDRYDADHSPASRDAKWIRFHDADLRERIAQAIDQSWAEVKDRPHPDIVADGPSMIAYRSGYLDGLEHAEGIARFVSLTGDTGPMSADDDTEADDHDLCARDYGEAIDEAQERIAAALDVVRRVQDPRRSHVLWTPHDVAAAVERALTDAGDDAPTTTTEDMGGREVVITIDLRTGSATGTGEAS